MEQKTEKISCAGRPLSGTIRIPGDKSISHRAVMLGALAKGDTEITGFLESADCHATVSCFEKLGISITGSIDKHEGPMLVVHGKGLYGLSAPSSALDVKNSATTARLLCGILSAQAFTSTLTGDDSLCSRPMQRVFDPLTRMGAQFAPLARDGCCPVQIHGARLKGIDYASPVASAQVKSALLLAGLYAEGATVIREPFLSRNHSEIMLRAFGADVTGDLAAIEENGAQGAVLTVKPGRNLTAQRIRVPGDLSSAAYFIAAALLVEGSEIVIRRTGVNPTRTGFLKALADMGADISAVEVYESDEPCADLLVRASALAAPNGRYEVSGAMIPSMIDDLVMFAITAAFAEGETVIRDAGELRTKESDRLRLVADNLLAMGADVTPTEDGMIIRGGQPLHGTHIKTHGDHRIAMGFAIAALRASGETLIDDAECINVSYPGFFRDLSKIT